jgi:hypothetical protein
MIPSLSSHSSRRCVKNIEDDASADAVARPLARVLPSHSPLRITAVPPPRNAVARKVALQQSVVKRNNVGSEAVRVAGRTYAIVPSFAADER